MLGWVRFDKAVFGCSSAFSLAGRGPGECGVGVTDVIRLDIDQAKEALANAGAATDAKSKSDALYAAVVAAARALLLRLYPPFFVVFPW